MSRVSTVGERALCSFCHRQLDGVVEASGYRGGVVSNAPSGPKVFLCARCGATNAVADLLAHCVLDAGLDSAAVRAAFLARYDAVIAG